MRKQCIERSHAQLGVYRLELDARGGWRAGNAQVQLRVGDQLCSPPQIDAHLRVVEVPRRQFELISRRNQLAQARESDAAQWCRALLRTRQRLQRQIEQHYPWKNRSTGEVTLEAAAARGHGDGCVHWRLATIAATMKAG